MRNTPVLKEATYLPKYSKTRQTVKAVGGLQYLKGNHKPYFSLTKEEHRLDHPGQRQSFGCDHETILKLWPDLADLAALHLADIDGVPMHAEANGWYNLAGALPFHASEEYHAGNSKRNFPKPHGGVEYRFPTPDECLQFFADHTRVDLATARVVRDRVEENWRETRGACEESNDELSFTWSKPSWRAARAWYAAWIEEQGPRWKAEAGACIAKHGLVVFGDSWEGVR